MKRYPYADNKGQTHFEGCYRTRHHHNCAVVEVDRLTAELEDAREREAQVRKDLHEAVDALPPYEATQRIEQLEAALREVSQGRTSVQAAFIAKKALAGDNDG